MTVSKDIKKVIQRVGSDIKAIVDRTSYLEKNLGYLGPNTSSVRSDQDADGKYRKITYTRADGTLLQVSRVEFDPSLELVYGIYNKRVTVTYDSSGLVATGIFQYHLKYDELDCIVSETLLP